MSQQGNGGEPLTWEGDVEFSQRPGGDFAYRPGEVILRGSAEEIQGAAALLGRSGLAEGGELVPLRDRFASLSGVRDVVLSVDLLTANRYSAQPNHVVFADTCDCTCPPHPSAVASGQIGASPVYASPVYASPVYASPVYASPVYASPVYASPVYASEYRTTGRRKSSAVAVDPATPPAMPTGNPANPVRVVVLDTGVASGGFSPAALPTTSGDLVDLPDSNGDVYLDPAAGHGTFIAGLIHQVAPGCDIRVERHLGPLGDGDEKHIAKRIEDLAAGPSIDFLSLSFSGYEMTEAAYLAAAIAQLQATGTVVVASAGNDATCRPTIPASIAGVISVGAIGPDGPAPFTNYGCWVRACAPGVDLVSAFFEGFDGAEPAVGGIDPDEFVGWAQWSGTSFSAPVVVGALAREVMGGRTPAEAVERVIDGPSLLRIPMLGTVVNVL